MEAPPNEHIDANASGSDPFSGARKKAALALSQASLISSDEDAHVEFDGDVDAADYSDGGEGADLKLLDGASMRPPATSVDAAASIVTASTTTASNPNPHGARRGEEANRVPNGPRLRLVHELLHP